MNEDEWLMCDSARDMMYFLWHNTGDRKKYWLAFACLGLDEIHAPRAAAVVKAIEAFADGQAAADDLVEARREIERLQREMSEGRFDGCSAFDLVHLADLTDMNLVDAVMDFATPSAVREIFGNPFRPVVFDPSWLTDTAVALASQMYDSRDFSAMPILGDALQDAGCDNADVLSHCRESGSHVRGCWVVDLVLRKE